MGKLIVISGPSGAGKSPLHQALEKFYPEIADRMNKLILYNSRSPRPRETEGKDYYFRSRLFIKGLQKKENFLVLDVRGDLQAVDIEELKNSLKKADMLFEGNPFIGKTLLLHPSLKNIKKISVFISPLSREEIIFFQSLGDKLLLPELVTEVMKRKLLRRTEKQKGILSLADLENIEKRARSAYGELKEACQFKNVIPNHDGEDSENWSGFYYPLGEARKTLLSLVEILKGKSPSYVEKWDNGLL
ncbi:MAG: Guanylate kinase [candidate division WS2 bacterium]|uniref:Guanylate kinase n=1 Tax=Psychracetigena formicireducens TaxID=2986056 RepID=A0A9E2BIT4_PSYF1|nr:Guanylate kinase [Candidatus Psychracetigena formicireducens]